MLKGHGFKLTARHAFGLLFAAQAAFSHLVVPVT